MRKRQKRNEMASCCPSKPELTKRPLIGHEKASELGGLFKILCNESRLRLLHALARSGELCVSDLAETIKMKPQAVSNQLQRLVGRGILSSRREGNSIYYHIADPCVVTLLDQGLCLMEDARRAPQIRKT